MYWKGQSKTQPSPCDECGAEFPDFPLLAEHQIAEHGYKREGAQVFKPKKCMGCGKPALYQVGYKLFCKEHLPQANLAAKQWTANIDSHLMARKDKEGSEFEEKHKAMDSLGSLKSTKKGHGRRR